MFNNIGLKIKKLAKVLCWIGIIISVISGIAMMASGNGGAVLTGLLVIGLGSLISWLLTLTLYGFGQLVDNSDIIAK